MQDQKPMAHQHGLEWIEKPFSLKPRWTIEPSIPDMRTLLLPRLPYTGDVPYHFTFFAQGTFNKLYKVSTNAGTWLMRVALPVDPHRKTTSEVATIRFMADHTDIPIPRVIAYNAFNDNPLGFEWMLLDFMPGTSLGSVWRTIPMSQKHDIVKQLATYQAQLFDHRFQSIGNLYKNSGQSHFELGPMVSLHFFYGDRGARDIHRGPFKNSFEWLTTRLNLVLEEQQRILETSKDEDIIEHAQTSKSLAQQLLGILPEIFSQKDLEETIIFHDDLSMQNILANAKGIETAIIDWECVSALPLWRACQYPKLLDGRIRNEEPHMIEYGTEDLYWERLLEYERGQLRQVFWKEMEQLRPQWTDEHRRGELKMDFERAVFNCDNRWSFKSVQAWLGSIHEGKAISLEKLLLE